jgi:hypothetical protein
MPVRKRRMTCYGGATRLHWSEKMQSLTFFSVSSCPGRRARKGEIVVGDFPVRCDSVNRGGVSAGGERISPRDFRMPVSSRHLTIARARRKFSHEHEKSLTHQERPNRACLLIQTVF